MGNITIQGDLTGDVPGGEVGGASNLTTVGAIPYVSAAGTLNQDPTALFWDASGKRLRSGIASSGAESYIGALPSGSFGGVWFGTSSPGNTNYTVAGNGSNSFLAAPSGFIAFNVSSAERARFAATTGNLLIGTTTDSNFKLDVAASGSVGTARFYGGSGVSDTTKVVVRSGGGQSGNLQEWQNANGVVTAYTTSAGEFGQRQSSVDKWYLNYPNFYFANAGTFAWSSTADAFGALDLSISRASAGVLQVGNGGANANGYIGFGNGAGIIGTANSLGLIYTAGQIEFRSPTASRLMTLGGTGTISVYNETATTGVTKAVIRAGAGQSTTNLTEWQNNAGSVVASVNGTGYGVFTQVQTDKSAGVQFINSTIITAGTDSTLLLRNAAQTDFSRLQFGGTTSSFPALKRSSNALNVRLADDSGDAGMSAAYILASNGTGIYFQIVNSAAPSLKRSGTTLQVRLGDDSANTQIQASRFISDQTTPSASTDAGTAGAIWADANYIYVQTAAGTIKRVALTTF